MSEEIKNISKTIERLKEAEIGKDLSKFGKDFQMKLMSLLVKDKVFSLSILPIIKHEYFADPFVQSVFLTLRKYVEEYHTLPNFDNISIMLKPDETKKQAYEKILRSMDTMELPDRQFIMDNARRFCATKHALAENEKVRAEIMNGDFKKAQSISMESFKDSGISSAKMFSLKKDYEMVFNEEAEHNAIPTPFETFNENMKGGPGKGNLVIMVAPSNFGKSYLAGTQVLMYDKTIRNIEDITVGEKVMGWDGKLRTVKALDHGWTDMYRIDQNSGDSYTVNKRHDLCVVNSCDEVKAENVRLMNPVQYIGNGEKLMGFKSPFFVKGEVRTEITVTPVGVGEYFGFEIEEDDKMFLLADFTVVHNTNALVAFTRHANLHKKTVVFFSFEIGGSDILRRHLAGLNEFRQEDVKNNRKAIEKRLSDPELGDFILIEDRATNARISGIKNHLEYLKSTGVYPDEICIDSLNQLKLPVGMKYEGDNQKFEYLAEELRDMANEYHVPVISVFQTNRCNGLETKVLCKEKGEIEMRSLQKNDMILTHDGYKKVLNIYYDSAPLYKVKLKSGKEFRISAKHLNPTATGELKSIENGLNLFDKLLIKKDTVCNTDTI